MFRFVLFISFRARPAAILLFFLLTGCFVGESSRLFLRRLSIISHVLLLNWRKCNYTATAYKAKCISMKRAQLADKRSIPIRSGSHPIYYPIHPLVYICYLGVRPLSLARGSDLSLWQVRNIFTLFTKIKTIPQYFLATADTATAAAASLFPSSTSFFASAASFFRRRTNFPKNFPQFSSVKFWSVSWQRVPSVVRREPRGSTHPDRQRRTE